MTPPPEITPTMLQALGLQHRLDFVLLDATACMNQMARQFPPIRREDCKIDRTAVSAAVKDQIYTHLSKQHGGRLP